MIVTERCWEDSKLISSSVPVNFGLSHSVVFDSSVTPWTVATRLLSPWNFPGKRTGVGSHFLCQDSFLTQGWNSHLLYLLHWQADSLPEVSLGNPQPWSIKSQDYMLWMKWSQKLEKDEGIWSCHFGELRKALLGKHKCITEQLWEPSQNGRLIISSGSDVLGSTSQEGEEDLLHIQGQEGWLLRDTRRPRWGTAAALCWSIKKR